MARCTCRYRDGEGPGAEPLERDLYCPFHGRIRDMDSGSSPFVDPNVSARLAGDAYESDYQRRLQREANEADAHGTRPAPKTREEFVEALAEEVDDLKFVSKEDHERVRQAVADEARDVKFTDRYGGLNMEDALNASFDELKAAAPPGCKCDYSQQLGEPVQRHYRQECPVHND